ncbi:MAG TPA: hypothetical protein VHI75_08530 [Casimicrobiaceae bacterium]|nr:hypothetical protein [Casimicrobiaceae bacterium]
MTATQDSGGNSRSGDWGARLRRARLMLAAAALNRGHGSDPIRTVRGSGYALDDQFGKTASSLESDSK